MTGANEALSGTQTQMPASARLGESPSPMWKGICDTAPLDHGHVGTHTQCCQNFLIFKRSSKSKISDLLNFEDSFQILSLAGFISSAASL